MSYATLDIEITRPLPEVRLAPDQSGVAAVVRRHGRPIGFAMRALAPGSVLAPEELERLLGEEVPRRALVEAVRDEILPRDAPPPQDVTVAVCTRGRPELLAECLQSVLALRRGEAGAGPGFEVLVVDNDPPDGRTREVAEALPVRYVVEPRPGLNFARNRALREAGGRVVAFVDDDVVVDAGWLAGLEEALDDHPDAAAVTGLVLPRELVTEAQIIFERRGGFRAGFARARYHGSDRPDNPLYPLGAGIFGAGCNMALRRDAALGIGGFDEALDTGAPHLAGGDLDMFYRLVRGGLPLIYEPRMLVFHRHRREHRALRRQYWTWGQGFMGFTAKTFATDPAQRRKLLRLWRWWFRELRRELVATLRGRGSRPVDLVVAELAGALSGLAGAYPRSVRRMRAVRERLG